MKVTCGNTNARTVGSVFIGINRDLFPSSATVGNSDPTSPIYHDISVYELASFLCTRSNKIGKYTINIY